MNILRLFIVAAVSLGFGFGYNEIESRMNDNDVRILDESEEIEECHHFGEHDEDFYTHILERVPEEQRDFVSEFIDSLLTDYGVTLEDLDENTDLWDDIMWDVMVFMNENDIEFEHHHDEEGHGHHDEQDHGSHMWSDE